MNNYKRPQHKDQFLLGAIMGVILIVTLIYAVEGKASEVECLAKIAYAEARGESIKGVVAVMQTTLHHSKQSHKTVCNTPAKQKELPGSIGSVFLAAAREVLNGTTKDVTGGAVAWRSKGQKAKGGVSTGKIGGHEFFTVKHLALK
jgi:hypothetical protein